MSFLEIISLVIGLIAIRFILKIDINEFLKSGREKKMTKLRNTCPHATFGKDEYHRVEPKSLTYLINGTNAWCCEECGLALPYDFAERKMEYWRMFPGELSKQHSEFYKQAQKMGLAP